MPSALRQQHRPRPLPLDPAKPAFDPLPWLAGALLVAAVFIAYRPAAGASFIWDDNDYVTENLALRTPGGLVDIWADPSKTPQYYPMVFSTFWLEFQAWNVQPRGYHEVNVLLHAASAVLLWRLLTRLRVPGAFFAALVFALHPVMVESVAWVTERKNTLSLLFYLLSLGAYLRFAGVDSEEQVRPRRWGTYAAALALFACALLSKSVTASLPAAVLLIVWWKRGRLTLRDVPPLLPFFALGALAGWHTSHLELTHVGAGGAEWGYSPAQRLLIAGRAVWFYLGKLLLPAQLTFTYPKWPVDAGAAWQWLFPAALLGAIALLFALRHKIGRGPLAAALIYVGTLVPALGFVNIFPMRYTFVADHYQYHASAAMIALVVGAAATLLERSNVRRRLGRARLAVAALIALTLCVLTWRQSSIYTDPQTLWADTVRKDPNSWLGWTQLGNIAANSVPPQREAAGRYYRKAVELASNVADTHLNMGRAYFDERNDPAALAEFDRTIAIEPRYTDAYYARGQVLHRMGRTDDAVVNLKKAIELDPEHARARLDLGRIYRDRGDLGAAVEQLTRATQINPRKAEAQFLLAECLMRQDKPDAARAAYEAILSFEPDNADAHFRLGMVLKKLGRLDEAQPHLFRALTLKPELQKLIPGLGR